jgi:hypothetical protein
VGVQDGTCKKTLIMSALRRNMSVVTYRESDTVADLLHEVSSGSQSRRADILTSEVVDDLLISDMLPKRASADSRCRERGR